MSKTMYSLAILLCAQVAHADLGDQLAKLLADDGASLDHFGISVAISGTTAIVGAFEANDNGDNSGSAYLFDTATGKKITKLVPNDGAFDDRFGFSVAISGATAIVGAYYHDDNGGDSGSTYLFDTTTGKQLFKLLANDGTTGDFFGYSVAISGVTAIVGAYGRDDNGPVSGSAYLFDVASGKQIAKLLPDDGASFDHFGISVAISGATAIVAARYDGDNGTDSGSAYLFDATTGKEITKLLPNDGEAGDEFGVSVAISGDTAIVGAHFDDDNANGTLSGSAYLFDVTTGKQIAKLLASDGAISDQFGVSVAISSITAIVGAWRDDDNGNNQSGSAYLFYTTTGQQITKFLPDDGEVGDEFGVSVAISDEIAIVGAWDDDDNGVNSGSAYLFHAAPCPSDLNDDGTVGVPDLLILLGFWGPCQELCLGDLDGEDNVGVKDLLILLGNWGPCP